MTLAERPMLQSLAHDLPAAGFGLAAPSVSSRPAAPGAPEFRTIWGLDPVQLHTRYWASLGVQVVRQGEPSEIVKHAELYLLTDPGSLTLFKLSLLMDSLNWVRPQVLFVRLHDARERGYRENAVTDSHGNFVRFQRLYDASQSLTRVVMTPDREVAQLWQSAPDPLTGWRRLRRFSKRTQRATQTIAGSVYDRNDSREVSWFVHDLVQAWKRPDSTVLRARQVTESSAFDGFGKLTAGGFDKLTAGGLDKLTAGKLRSSAPVWRDAQARIHQGVKFIGPVWVGAGREVEAGATVIGPAVIWDDPKRRPVNDAIQWLQIEPKEPPPEPSVKDATVLDRAVKRCFDIACALFGLSVSLPLYPFIMLAIWIEDGRPFFFGHTRESRGAREFPCWKFRSMRKDAEKMKAELKKLNQADGPQFFMENDPRLTRVGKFLRKYNLDELPQLLNVLLGDMSVVGPRPSPYSENQYCPAWREARLSVRPGITGLWQVKRTRRTGSDFQEWIKYDIEYVERRNLWLDLKIIYKTFANVFGKLSRS
jgi:lipopolysaccharide/colanic/teichoic acid biosynthesis glycosyltransferase